MTNVREHTFTDVLRRYIRGCNRGDETLLRSTLAEDVTVYFLHIPPAQGREAVVQLWKQYHDETATRWSIDDLVIEGDKALMEWSALRGRNPERAQFDRGIDWYAFRNGLISEIRQYGDPRGILPDGQTYEQLGFPYAERGYPIRETIDSHVP